MLLDQLEIIIFIMNYINYETVYWLKNNIYNTTINYIPEVHNHSLNRDHII